MEPTWSLHTRELADALGCAGDLDSVAEAVVEEYRGRSNEVDKASAYIVLCWTVYDVGTWAWLVSNLGALPPGESGDRILRGVSTAVPAVGPKDAAFVTTAVFASLRGALDRRLASERGA